MAKRTHRLIGNDNLSEKCRLLIAIGFREMDSDTSGDVKRIWYKQEWWTPAIGFSSFDNTTTIIILFDSVTGNVTYEYDDEVSYKLAVEMEHHNLIEKIFTL